MRKPRPITRLITFSQFRAAPNATQARTILMIIDVVVIISFQPNVCDNRVAAIDLPFVNAPSATPRSSLGSSASWSITDRQLKHAKKLPYQFSDADLHLTFARNTVPEFLNLIVPDFVAIDSGFVLVPCRLA